MKIGNPVRIDGIEYIEMFPITPRDVKTLGDLSPSYKKPSPVNEDHPRVGQSPILVDIRAWRHVANRVGLTAKEFRRGA